MDQARYFVSRPFDLAFFHLPVWVTWAIALALPVSIRELDEPLWFWIAIVLCIDVGHVWSSIYRTYLDPVTRAAQPAMLRWTPIVAFGGCFLLALHAEATLWRVLAYVAVYHFVKQQHGIAALYAARYHQVLGTRAQELGNWRERLKRLDRAAVYAGTICPLLWWHLHLPRNISWFVEGDFISLTRWRQAMPAPLALALELTLVLIWLGVPIAWLLAHLRVCAQARLPLPTGKLLWVGGTAINWYLGLVLFDSDLVFTLTNVVAHGIPYFGLIALHRFRVQEPRPPMRAIALLLVPILALAFSEEWLWDFLLYADRPEFFGMVLPYAEALVSSPIWRAFWMAALSLPQTVHYILDGTIWKLDGRNPDLRQALFPPITAIEENRANLVLP